MKKLVEKIPALEGAKAQKIEKTGFIPRRGV